MALTRLGLDDKRLRQTVRDSLRIPRLFWSSASRSHHRVTRSYGGTTHSQEFMKDGQTVPFETARAQIEETLVTARREMLVDEWVNGLRRRADINNVYLSRP